MVSEVPLVIVGELRGEIKVKCETPSNSALVRKKTM